MACVLFFHRHHRQAVGAPFRRQIEIDNFRKLFLQDRDEDFIQRHAQHRRLIRRTAGIGRMINRVFTLGNMGNRKHRELVYFIVVAGMVAIRTFRRHLPGLDITFQHNLCAGRHFKIVRDAFHHFGFGTAQQPGKGIFRQRIRHRGHRAKNGRWVGAERHRNREAFARTRRAPLLEIQCAAAMRQPAHNQFVFANQLLAINPQVLPLFVRPTGHRQPPGDQRRGIFRPAGHNRDFPQVDVIALDDFLLTGGAAQTFGGHIQHLLKLRQLIKQIAETFGRLRLFQKG